MREEKEINDRNMWSYGKQRSRQHELKILFTFNIIASGIVYHWRAIGVNELFIDIKVYRDIVDA